MAALSVENQAVIEAWCGSIDPAEMESVEQRFGRLQSGLLVSLEVLMGRYAEILREPMRMRLDGDVTWETDRNAAALLRQISALANLVQVRETLNSAGDALVASAKALGEPGKVVRAVTYDYVNVRPG